MTAVRTIPAGSLVKLAMGGVPGLGGLNRHWLAENDEHGGPVRVTKAITWQDGAVRLKNGRVIQVTTRDVLEVCVTGPG